MVLLLSENNKKEKKEKEKKTRLFTRACFVRKRAQIIYDSIATCAVYTRELF